MVVALYHFRPEKMGLITESLSENKISPQEIFLPEEAKLPDPAQVNGAIVMGGPMSANDEGKFPFLTSELRFIDQLLKYKKPILGICLGAQLIAKCLGSRIFTNPVNEIGWAPLELTEEGKASPLFDGIPDRFNVLHWHGETFDLPKNAIHLAFTPQCRNQAFQYGDNVVGFQFHLEMTPSIVQNLVESSEGRQDVLSVGSSKEAILNSTKKEVLQLRPLALRIFSSYLKQSYLTQV